MYKRLQKAFPIIACSLVLSYFKITEKAMMPIIILFISGYIIYKLTDFINEDILCYEIIDIIIIYGFIMLIDVYISVIKYDIVGPVIIPSAMLCITTGYYYGYNADLLDYDPECWEEDDEEEDNIK